MLKKGILLFSLSAAFFVILGCDTATNGAVKSNSPEPIQFTEGWWKYQADISDSQVTYIQYNSKKEILRAGTNNGEYPSAYLAGKKDVLSFDFLSKTSTKYTFVNVLVNELPWWATLIEQPETPFPNDPSPPAIPPFETPEEPEPIQPTITGVWWLFVDGWYVNGFPEDLYVYYEGNNLVKGGTRSYQIPKNDILLAYMSKDEAISLWIGPNYQLTDSSQYPFWAY